jgi:hypothetical protein
VWTRCCFTCWPKGYKNTCEESWGQWFRIGVRTLRGLQETLRVRERRRAGWPPPGERCSGSTSSERTGDVSPAAGDAAGRRVVPRVSAPRGAQGELCPGAGCRPGGPRSCARCGRSRWRTSSAACRAGGLSRFRALRGFPAASAGPSAVLGCPEGREAAWRASGRRCGCGSWTFVAGCAAAVYVHLGCGLPLYEGDPSRSGCRCGRAVFRGGSPATAVSACRGVPAGADVRPGEGRHRPSVADHGSTAGFPGAVACRRGPPVWNERIR